MIIYDCSLSVWGPLQQHPFITVLIIEPAVFTVAISLLFYGLKLQESLHWRNRTSIGYIIQVIVSLFSYTIGATLGIVGLISGAIAAIGFNSLTNIAFISLPLIAGFIIFCLVIKDRGYRNINSYIKNDRY